MISFEILGYPKGKGRPRFGNGVTYTPEDTREYERYVKACYLKRAGSVNLTEKPIKMQILVTYPIPKSFSKAKWAAAELGKIKPTKKPDCDNIIKIICDALNLVAYKDDKQIVEITCVKRYGTEACVDVIIEETSGE